MKTVFLFLSAILSFSAMAYTTGTYNCKNSDAAFPPDIFKISDVDLNGAKVPYVEVTRHYRENIQEPKSRMLTTVIAGFAAVSTTDTTEVFMVGSGLRFEFDNGVLFGCKAP